MLNKQETFIPLLLFFLTCKRSYFLSGPLNHEQQRLVLRRDCVGDPVPLPTEAVRVAH